MVRWSICTGKLVIGGETKSGSHGDEHGKIYLQHTVSSKENHGFGKQMLEAVHR